MEESDAPGRWEIEGVRTAGGDATRRTPLIVFLVVAGLTQGVSIIYNTGSENAVSLFQQSEIPIQLAAGPQGSTTINANKTGSLSSVTGGLAAASFNTTFVNDTSATAYRIRFTHVSTSGTFSECVQCDIQLRAGTTTSTQISYSLGSLVTSQGAYQTIDAPGGAASSWHIWAVATRTVLADQVVTVAYVMEIVPTGGTSPSVVYFNMTMKFTV
ncbi:MAG: hypothetical protein HY556_10135 [Euryarchaeota archaeon]|nr:hypothetical protein [Euryarchaeota archaeon]